MPPAAVVTSTCTPVHVPPILTASSGGSMDVQINNLNAWRTMLDIHVCSLPIAPPAPAPHGPEICFKGSMTVFINNQMAVRQGDLLPGAGPPNKVELGVQTVEIGDVAFGLADPANIDEF